jgi:hypothetical protein
VLVPAVGRAQALAPLPAWRPAPLVAESHLTDSAVVIATTRPASQRLRHGLIGGAIGAVAGAAVCTAISNLTNEGTGFSSCTRKGYLLFGAGGFALGFAVGWVL